MSNIHPLSESRQRMLSREREIPGATNPLTDPISRPNGVTIDFGSLYRTSLDAYPGR